MSINQEDNLRKLSSLFYPAIDATGNEYYGQNRKLVLDSTFDKEFPFESGIEPIDHNNCQFTWKLGPLSDSIKTYTIGNDNYGELSTFPDVRKIVKITKLDNNITTEFIKDLDNNINNDDTSVGVAFAKYILNISKDSVANDISAGRYNTFEYNAAVVLDSIVITNNLNPIDKITNDTIDYDVLTDSEIESIKFLLDDRDANNLYLYVKVCVGVIKNKVAGASSEDDDLDNSEYLVLKAVGGDVNFTYTFNHGDSWSGIAPTYEYSTNDGSSWQSLSGNVVIEDGKHILLKCTARDSAYVIPHITENSGAEEPGPLITYDSIYTDRYGESPDDWSLWEGYDFDDYLYYTNLKFEKVLSYSNAKVEAYGNLESMLPSSAGYNVAAFAYLFNNCTLLTRAPKLPSSISQLCYYKTFKGCVNLTKAPDLPAPSLATACYKSMFEGCTKLIESPYLSADASGSPPDFSDSTYECYERMFYGCASLKKVSANKPSFSDYYTKDWMVGVGSNGSFVSNDVAAYNDSLFTSGIPTTWMMDGKRCPLTLIARNGSVTVTLSSVYSGSDTSCNSYKYCTDRQYLYNPEDSSWETYSSPITIQQGEIVSFRRSSGTYYSNNANKYVKFVFSGNGNIEAYGNVRSLIDEISYTVDDDNLVNLANIEGEVWDSQSSSYNSGTATYNYYNLFNGCAKLIKAPDLYETTLSDYCYANMFRGCTSILNAPSSSAVDLAAHCFEAAFRGCNGLLNTPDLKAVQLAEACYKDMFFECTSLKTVSELPSTTLAKQCYYRMFLWCESIEDAPRLVAKSLVNDCYTSMFAGCSSLKGLTCLAKEATSANVSNWISTPSSGTSILYATPKIEWYSISDAIPSGWALYHRNYSYNKESLDNKIETVGTNSVYNGRGNIYDASTLYNMDLYSTVASTVSKANSYNETDGSATQEIWGYKCFNSPITFKNGIYGNNSSIVSYEGVNINNNAIDSFSSIYNSNLWVNKDLHGSELKCNIGNDGASLNASQDAAIKVYHQSVHQYGQQANVAIASSAELSITNKDNLHSSSARVIARSIRSVDKVGGTEYQGYYDVAKLQAGGAFIEVVHSRTAGPNANNTKDRPNADRIYTGATMEPSSAVSGYVNDRNIGAADNKYNKVYANTFNGNLNGAIPYVTHSSNKFNIPVGAIFVAYISDSIDLGYTLKYYHSQDAWKSSGNTITTVGFSSFNGGYYEELNSLSIDNNDEDMEFALLSQCYAGATLVMRIK